MSNTKGVPVTRPGSPNRYPHPQYVVMPGSGVKKVYTDRKFTRDEVHERGYCAFLKYGEFCCRERINKWRLCKKHFREVKERYRQRAVREEDSTDSKNVD